MQQSIDRLYKLALGLSVFTITYNVLEGIISIFFGAEDETLTLFGFGADSIIEVISGIGIFIMIRRIQKGATANKSKGEVLALRITGYSFYTLILILVLSSIAAIVTQHKPTATISGIIISSISIAVMIVLARLKISTGKKLASKAIIADGNCTMVCVYMSVVLLVSSLLYQWTHIAYIDVAGSLGLCWFCYHEGREALENAADINKSGCC